MGFPGGSDGKESACNVGDLGLIPGLGRSPGGEHGNPLQYSCLENPLELRSLASYSPWGRKELDNTERLSIAQHMVLYVLISLNMMIIPCMDIESSCIIAHFQNIYFCDSYFYKQKTEFKKWHVYFN